MPAEVLKCDGEKMRRRLRSAAEQDAMMVLRKKLGVEEAKAAILGDPGYGAAEGPSEMHGVTRPLGNVWGDRVPSCWEKGRRGSQGQAWNSDQYEGEKKPGTIGLHPNSRSIFPTRSECSFCRSECSLRRRTCSRGSACHGARLCFIERVTKTNCGGR